MAWPSYGPDRQTDGECGLSTRKAGTALGRGNVGGRETYSWNFCNGLGRRGQVVRWPILQNSLQRQVAYGILGMLNAKQFDIELICHWATALI